MANYRKSSNAVSITKFESSMLIYESSEFNGEKQARVIQTFDFRANGVKHNLTLASVPYGQQLSDEIAKIHIRGIMTNQSMFYTAMKSPKSPYNVKVNAVSAYRGITTIHLLWDREIKE